MNAGGFIRVAALEELPRGEGKVCRVGESEVALFHLESGEVLALDNTCPHEQGPLAHGILAGDVVTCPLHGLKIDLRSGAAIDDEGRARVYAVRVEDGEVWLGPSLLSS